MRNIAAGSLAKRLGYEEGRRLKAPIVELCYKDDELGTVNDAHGFNAVDNQSDPMDDNGHGTHCAGIIGAALAVHRRSGAWPLPRETCLSPPVNARKGPVTDAVQ